MIQMIDKAETERRTRQGMKRAADAQGCKDPQWKDRALDAIKYVAFRTPTVHRDQVRHLMDYDEPHHPNAWGSIWRQAVKLEYIKPTGKKVMSQNPQTRHPYEEYQSLLYLKH